MTAPPSFAVKCRSLSLSLSLNAASWNMQQTARDMMTSICGNIVSQCHDLFPSVPDAIRKLIECSMMQIDLLLPNISVLSKLIFEDLYYERTSAMAEDMIKWMAITQGHCVKEDATHNPTIATRVRETHVSSRKTVAQIFSRHLTKQLMYRRSIGRQA